MHTSLCIFISRRPTNLNILILQQTLTVIERKRSNDGQNQDLLDLAMAIYDIICQEITVLNGSDMVKTVRF